MTSQFIVTQGIQNHVGLSKQNYVGKVEFFRQAKIYPLIKVY